MRLVFAVACGQWNAGIAQQHVSGEFGAENLFRPLSQIGLGFEGCEERQVPALAGVLCRPARINSRAGRSSASGS